MRSTRQNLGTMISAICNGATQKVIRSDTRDAAASLRSGVGVRELPNVGATNRAAGSGEGAASAEGETGSHTVAKTSQSVASTWMSVRVVLRSVATYSTTTMI